MVSEEIRPAGTRVENAVMRTPMVNEGDFLVARVQVSFATTIDYGFSITKNRSGADIKAIWDGSEDYQKMALGDDVIEVRPTLTLTYDQGSVKIVDAPLVNQEIRYHMPESGEVFLVRGIDGWYAVPEEIRPTGTIVKKGLMHTLMVQRRNTFVAKVQVPAGVMIEYGLLITKNRNGDDIEAILDGNENYQIDALEDGIVNVKTTVTLTQD